MFNPCAGFSGHFRAVKYRRLTTVTCVILILLWVRAERYKRIQAEEAGALLQRAVAAHGGLSALASPPHETVDLSRAGLDSHWPPDRVRLIRKGPSALLIHSCGPLVDRACRSPRGSWFELDGVVSRSSTSRDSRFESDDLTLGLEDLAAAARTRPPLENLGIRRLPDGERVPAVLVQTWSPLVLYFSPITGRVAALGYWLSGNTGKGDPPYVEQFGDYRRVGGVVRPLRMVSYAANAVTTTITSEIPDVRSPIPDSLFFVPPVPVIGQRTRTRLVVDRNEPMVECSVNGGRPLRFILDTGAELSYLSPAAADELRLRSTGAIGVITWTRPVTMGICRLRSLRIGNVTIGSVAMGIADSLTGKVMKIGNYDGVLGYNFLARFRLALDFTRGRLELEPRSSWNTPGPGTRFDLSDGTPVVVAAVDGRSLEFKVDTGSEDTHLRSDEAARLNLRNRHYAGYFRLNAHLKVALLTAEIPKLRVGGANIESVLVKYLDPRAWHSQQLWVMPNLIGNDILERYHVTIDYGNQRLSLTPTEPL